MAYQQQGRSRELNNRLTQELDEILASASSRTRWQQRWLAFHLLFPLLLCAIVMAWSSTVSTDDSDVLKTVPSAIAAAASDDKSFADSLGCGQLSEFSGDVALASSQPGKQNVKASETSFFDSLSSAYLRSFEMRYCAERFQRAWMSQPPKGQNGG